MNDGSLMTAILVFGLAVGLFANKLGESALEHFERIKKIMKNNRLFKKKQEEVAQMREKGETHEWVNIPGVAGYGNLLVCKKTGWSPALQGFVPMDIVRKFVKKIELELEYKEFRDRRIEDLARSWNIPFPDMESLVEKIFAIKKDFHIMKMDHFNGPENKV